MASPHARLSGCPVCWLVLSLLVVVPLEAATNMAGPGEAGLRTALELAHEGDTVLLSNRVELVAPVRIEKRLAIRGASTTLDPVSISGRFAGELLQLAADGIVLDSLWIVGSPQTDGLRLEREATLQDCTISDCRRPIVDSSEPNVATLRLRRVAASRNLEGLEAWNLEAKDCIFSFSKATGSGAYLGLFEGCQFENNARDGLILTYGVVRNCTFRFNADLGLRFDPDPGVLAMSGCVFYANAGGGLLLREEAIATVDNCTFTRHTGPPVIEVSEAHNVLFRHCTVADNVVIGAGDPWSWPYHPAGAAFWIHNSGRVELQNCLVADNPTNDTPQAAGLVGDWVDGGGNVIGGPARLGALRDNGGPALTLLPSPESPAIDAARPSDLVSDGRGLSRQAGTAPDAGAVELGAAAVADEDRDGMPDLWERFHQLDPADPNDAASDLDADGQNAAAEFHSRTDPADPRSVHRFEEVVLIQPPVLQPNQRLIYLIWPIRPGLFYQVETSTDLRAWRKAPFTFHSESRRDGQPTLRYELRADTAKGFYRVKVWEDTLP